MVGIRRLELPRVAPLVPETSASTSSAICPMRPHNTPLLRTLQQENEKVLADSFYTKRRVCAASLTLTLTLDLFLDF